MYKNATVATVYKNETIIYKYNDGMVGKNYFSFFFLLLFPSSLPGLVKDFLEFLGGCWDDLAVWLSRCTICSSADLLKRLSSS